MYLNFWKIERLPVITHRLQTRSHGVTSAEDPRGARRASVDNKIMRQIAGLCSRVSQRINANVALTTLTQIFTLIIDKLKILVYGSTLFTFDVAEITSGLSNSGCPK